MTIPPETRDSIESRVKEFLTHDQGPLAWLLPFVRAHVALPLYVDWEDCCAICPDGDVVTYRHDSSLGAFEGDNPRLEYDARLRNLALVQGARKYPELAPLIPPRPRDAKDCNTCKGGTIALPDPIVCHCGGIGWLPASAPDWPPTA